MFTKEQAKKLFASKFWEKMDAKDVAIFQLSQDMMTMPFQVFHTAIETCLGHGIDPANILQRRYAILKELSGVAYTKPDELCLKILPEEFRGVLGA